MVFDVGWAANIEFAIGEESYWMKVCDWLRPSEPFEP